MGNLEQSILGELPQIPFVMDQVGAALDWAQSELTEGEYNRMLDTAWSVTLYVKSISEPAFFKTHLVIAAILSFLKDPKENEKFKQFDTASKSIEKDLDKISILPKDIEDRGCFKAIMLNLIPLAKENQELFSVALIGIKHDILAITEGMKKANVNSPITPQDYITILGYSLVMANIRMSNLSLLNKTYEIYNEIEVLLNKLKY